MTGATETLAPKGEPEYPLVVRTALVPATDRKPQYVRASAWYGSERHYAVLGWDWALGTDENHRRAAVELLRLNGGGRVGRLERSTERGYVWRVMA